MRAVDVHQRAKRISLVAIGVLTVVALAVVVHRPLLGVHVVRAGAEPLVVRGSRFTHGKLGEVLSRHVVGGRVTYQQLVRDSLLLRRYVATVERVGPRTAPQRFPGAEDRLAFYINAYNAYVLLGVVAHWPIASVHDVDGPIEPVQGMGFFWAQRFVLEGAAINLYELEHEILRGQFDDARMHGAINCASASCPDLAAEPYVAGRLNQQLDAAARRLCREDKHVRVDKQAKRIVLSAIFDWFSGDFERAARRLGAGSTVLDWIAHYAGEGRAGALHEARRLGYAVTHAPYDWRLNTALPEHQRNHGH